MDGLSGLPATPRARKDAALLRARTEAYPEREFVGQENFMTASEILALARAAGVTAGSSVLDAACGRGGAALLLARELDCAVVGVDLSREAISLARAAADAAGLGGQTRFQVGDATRLPVAERFDVVLLLETMLVIENKRQLLAEVRRHLRPNGRFALTLEEGPPLSVDERRAMPEGDSVWLIAEAEFRSLLGEAGFQIRQVEDHTAAHADLARRLATALVHDREAIAAALGAAERDKILAMHARWAEWLTAGRVRKLAIVAERMT